MSAAIELNQIAAGYGERVVLENIDLEVREGEFLCLLGPNGAGKSTLLDVIAGALAPRSGRIRIFGHEPRALGRRALAQRIAVVPQEFQLAFPFTVQEVVLLGRVPHQGPFQLDREEDLAIARRAMEATEVAHLAGRRIDELSGGERKRVVVAKALAQEPRLLLLDEAGTHLDVRHQVGLYELIERVRLESGLTVVAAVHDLNLAAAYGQRFALLKGGRLRACGELEEVMTYHLLREVFDIELYVSVNELTGHRLFTPMRPVERTAP